MFFRHCLGYLRRPRLVALSLSLLLIQIYQCALSPFFGECCRFYPSCSEYAKEAIKKYGVCKGMALGLLRICKCGPWSRGGVDIP